MTYLWVLHFTNNIALKKYIDDKGYTLDGITVKRNYERKQKPRFEMSVPVRNHTVLHCC